MTLEPLTGGSTGVPPVVEGSVGWDCIDVERAFQLAAASLLDADQLRIVALALLRYAHA